MTFLALFFAGAFFCNSLPHLLAGLQGTPFPSPFAKPSGVGDSSPTVNFFWGFANLLAGLALLAGHPVAVGLNGRCGALCLGALLLGWYASRHFGEVKRRKDR